MHYSLSHSQDTPYWKNNFNKAWPKEILKLVPSTYSGFQAAIKQYKSDVNIQEKQWPEKYNFENLI